MKHVKALQITAILPRRPRNSLRKLLVPSLTLLGAALFVLVMARGPLKNYFDRLGQDKGSAMHIFSR